MKKTDDKAWRTAVAKKLKAQAGGYYNNTSPYFTDNPGEQTPKYQQPNWYQNNPPMFSQFFDANTPVQNPPQDTIPLTPEQLKENNQPSNPELMPKQPNQQYDLMGSTTTNVYNNVGDLFNNDGMGVQGRLNYGAYNLGKGNYPQAGLSLAAGFLGQAREGLSAFSIGKVQKEVADDYQKRQYGTPKNDYIYRQDGGEVNPTVLQYATLTKQEPIVVDEFLKRLSPQEQQTALGQMMTALQQGNQNPAEEVKEGVYSNAEEETKEMKQQGGKTKTNAAVANGEILMPEKEGTVEIEVGEVVKHGDTGDIQEAGGKPHEQGGTPVNLADGTKILSDHTKIGAANAKYFSDTYEIKIKANQTFADVMSKLDKKIGLEDINKEQQDIIKKTEKISKIDNPDANTQDINLEFLTTQMQELEKAKKPLEELKSAIFEDIFTKQEKIPKTNSEYNTMQDGGEFLTRLSKKYNIPVEQVTDYWNKYQFGGMTPQAAKYASTLPRTDIQPEQPLPITPEQIVANNEQMTQEQMAADMQTNPVAPIANQSSINNPYRVANIYEDPKMFNYQQDMGTGYYGSVITSNLQEQAKENARLHPRLYSQHFKDSATPADALAYQKGVNNEYELLKADAQRLYGNNPEKYKNFVSAINSDSFVNDPENVRGFDAKYGNFTGTRPNYALEILPQDELKKVNDAGVVTLSQLQEKFPDIYAKYANGLQSDAVLGAIPEQPIAETTNVRNVFNDFGLDFGNNPILIPPSPPEASLKVDTRLPYIDPAFITAEPQLIENARTQNAIVSNMSGYSPTEQAALLSGIFGQTTQANNAAQAQAETYNAAAQERADIYNAQTSGKNSILEGQNALSYENRTFATKAAFEDNLQRYFNRINEESALNRLNRNKARAYNSLNENYKVGSGTVTFFKTPLEFANTLTTDVEKQQFLAKSPKEQAAIVKYANLQKTAKKK